MPMTRREALRQQQVEDEDDVTPTGDESGTGELGRADDAASADTRPQRTPAFQLPTEQFLSTLMETITRAQADANRSLISSLLGCAGDLRASTPIVSAPSPNTTSATTVGGNFTRCTARFDGSSHDAEVLEAFLDAVEIYKECAAVSDEHALRGLPMLLEGEAAIWWRGIKTSVTTWPDALVRLRAIYGVTQPAHKIFRQIFAAEQQDEERAEVLLCRIRALIAKLPYKLEEVVQIDICYGLLHHKLKKRVPRDTIFSVDALLCNTRIAEDAMKEYKVNNSDHAKNRSQTKTSTPANGQYSARSTSPTASATVRSTSPTASATVRNRNRPRCSYCRAFGHISDECRNREKVPNSNNKGSGTSCPPTSIRCYGCGKPGVVRSKCDICKVGTSTSNKEEKGASFNNATINHYDSNSVVTLSRDVDLYYDSSSSSRVHLANAVVCDNIPHPMVNISIMGCHGVAIIDTGATHCIASPLLYRVLVNSGKTFQDTQRLVRLADGSQTWRTLLSTETLITIEGREVTCEFLVLPGAETRTLLGVQFLSQAGMVLDVAQGKWMFADDPEHVHDFVQTYTLKAADADLMRADSTELALRPDEGSKLSLEQRRTPSEFISNQAQQIARDGPATEFDLSVEYTPGRSNVIADTLSRPVCSQDPDCDVCFTTIDMPRRNSGNIRENQLMDLEVRKVIEDLESDEPTRGRPWSDRGYTISDGILYRYSLESDDEEDCCLVVPEHERRQVMADLHDSPTAGHFGVERTLSRVRSRFYWPGMRTFVTNYIKECVPCQRYKADNRKPAGLLQTPALSRRFEVVSVDLFGPLVETPRKNRWVLIVEDVCSRWVELFSLENATSVECAQTLANEVFLRYGVPRRLISDNGVQFVSEVMQQVCHVLGINQTLTPFYHPEANPIERKNRDLKPQLAILVGQHHSTWDLHLAAVRFAMNSAITTSTGFSPAYLTFGRELRAPSDSGTDMRTIIDEDNFVPSITPYLKRIAETLNEARDNHEKVQEVQKKNADKKRRTSPDYKEGDLVLLKTQGPNDAGRGQSAKFIPRRDGPYKIAKIVSPTTYVLESVQTGGDIGRYHVSHLTPFTGQVEAPIREKRKRGRPRRYLDS